MRFSSIRPLETDREDPSATAQVSTAAQKSNSGSATLKELITTSYVERSNLTWRMSNRRMTRLTNAFSKKAENHAHQLAINFMHYNFVRIHQTLRCTPAMAAGITEYAWSIEDLLTLDMWVPGFTRAA